MVEIGQCFVRRNQKFKMFRDRHTERRRINVIRFSMNAQYDMLYIHAKYSKTWFPYQDLNYFRGNKVNKVKI